MPSAIELKEALAVLEDYYWPLNSTPFPQPTFGHDGAQTLGNLNMGRAWSSYPRPAIGGDDYTKKLKFTVLVKTCKQEVHLVGLMLHFLKEYFL